ncbi:histone-lysine N-methyltransferase, H3 lysine-9 specific SUVH3-like protein [Actinidia rufa]|uniref:Histone-lysine N-methyltransferase, H3 lysine-9 specific SUVH3-like protein n=1 Tax=Actinidia rufa TaxID=165716 RepID=A0A7J0EA20_9ERIC|nr:histone-lysine N-methyltransferase, H3 lysine-9 specific SUVH3-like protein [Actinidia rufa]
MEQGLGSESVPVSGSVDKSRVLNVRPLRCIVPIFPSPPGMSSISSPQASPFVCVPPTGPFPPGVSPFFPFLIPTESQQNPQTPFAAPNQAKPIPSPVPITSFRTPTQHANGNAGSSRRSSRNRTTGVQSQSDADGYGDSQNQNDQYLSGFSMHVTSAEDMGKAGKKRGNSQRKTRSGREANTNTPDVDLDVVANDFLTSFNLMGFDTVRRADGDKETARYILMLYSLLRRRLTQVEDSKEATPGVTRRPDLRAGWKCAWWVLHAPSMGGIDYMSFKVSLDDEPVALSIVSSGSYEDNMEDGDALIYTGQGGILRRDKTMMDQKLEKGNLALEKSLHRGNEVRVIRGVKDEANPTPTAKIYLYDGLYKISESWVDKDKSGCSVFKYKLVRAGGQPEAFTLWKSIKQWKNDITSRVGVILPDLTSGAERLPVCIVNDVDHEKGPAYFTYFPSLKYPKPVDSPQSPLSCTCRGLKVRLEVFRTKDKGWGLRSWDPIRAGAFICEYAGEVVDKSTIQFGSENEDDYIFDATRTYEPVEVMPGNSDDSPKLPFPLVINANKGGNVARFMNHSCTPNVYWQPVLREQSYLHIAFFAICHIPPMKELTYDYGTVQPGKAEPRRKKCLCGSLKCRGYFY